MSKDVDSQYVLVSPDLPAYAPILPQYFARYNNPVFTVFLDHSYPRTRAYFLIIS